MDSPLSFFCPRCPDSTTAYSLDELREHVAKVHLEMTPLFTCPYCQSGFVYPSMALYHFRFVCCLQEHFLTTAFTKNLLSMDISFFYQLYLIETEAIRNLQSSGSTPTPASSPLVGVEEEPLVFAAEDQDDVNRFLKKLQTEIEGKVNKSLPKVLQIELRDKTARTIPIFPLTPQLEEYSPKDPNDYPISPRKSMKRGVESDSEQPVSKMQNPEGKKRAPPRCYMYSIEQNLRKERRQGSRKWNKQYGRRTNKDHACEYERCCDTYCREGCSFCDGLHRSQNCGAVIDFEERKMILRNKGFCTRCGVKHLLLQECSKIEMCKYCPSINHLSAFCSSIRYQRRLDQLKNQEMYSPSLEILQFRAERAAIYRKERQREERHQTEEKKPPISSIFKNTA